jgi:esterase/lipase
MSAAKELVSYPIPAWLQVFFRTTTFLSSKLSCFFALKIFFRPIPFPIPKRERKIRSSASSSEQILTSRQKKFKLFILGENSSGKILFIHGWSGRGSQFYALIDELQSKGFQCYFFDAPGHGEYPDTFCDMLTFIETIHQLDRNHGPFKALIGHSLGGMAALNAFNLGLKTKAIVTICSPSSIDGVVLDFANAIGAGEKLVLPIIQKIEKKYKRKSTDYSPTSFMSNYQLDGLIIQDRNDLEVPFVHAEQLSLSWNSAKNFYTDELGHRKVLSDPSVLSEISSFLLSAGRQNAEVE